MKKGALAKITTVVSGFILISSAAIPAFADGFEYGTGASAGDGGVAIGNDASGGIAIGSGYDLVSGASGGVAVGSGSSGGTTIGTGSEGTTSVGNGSASIEGCALGNGADNGTGGTAVGAGAWAKGRFSSVVGYGAYAWGGIDQWTINNSCAAGVNASASAFRTTAFGYQSSASGYASAAFGTNSSATADNSVALGYGSIADRVDSISVGSTGHERQIIHVADGTGDTDAANLGQLNQLGAMSAAIAGLTPMSYNSREHFQILANTGSYGGRQALGLGLGYYDAGSSLAVTAGMASSGGNRMGRLGFAWRPGHARPYKEVLVVDGTDQQGTIGKQDSQVQEIQKQLKRQQAQAKRQQAQDDKQQAELDKLQEQVNKMLEEQARGR